MDQVGVLLAESVPPPDFARGVVDAIRLIPGVRPLEDGTVLVLVGKADDQRGSETTASVDASTMRMMSERRVATLPIDGLELKPPIVLFEREILSSEELDAWTPPE